MSGITTSPNFLCTLSRNAQLLYEIYLYALSAYLPLTSRYLHAVFKSAPTSVQAEYLLGCYFREARPSCIARRAGLVSKVLQYPICNQLVLEAILRHPTCPRELTGHTELPRRLFRSLAPRPSHQQDKSPWSEDVDPLPFLRFLYNHPRIPEPDANRNEGYALTKAVYAGFLPLVSFLLDHGASPACKGGLPVMVAIKQKDLALVRKLIERDGAVRAGSPRKRKAAELDDTRQENAAGMEQEAGRQERRTVAKKRKLEDRMEVNKEMLKLAVKCDARNIVDYLMKEKGCVPDMQTLMLMRM
ncbi:hypothetical protein CERSUDRAFT_67549 [Gelatoporia subvermispora B]|uniref:Ankyrin repeat protein n=1 Tax=Ceriporiopsis subvermispora (strain B) TaxID=914234 RepID=M2QAH0_CERS8|nr:hypothetical protein CERSUDRAFT_67549 [Gelatoporia subvermispora B]